ncbi:MAG: DNA polymerase IV [Actinomycetota bacterium]|nr:DNA polymerase IV [Actinomycetota bacterium]
MVEASPPAVGERPREGAGRRRARVVLHVDMDAFFASVEVLDDPRLLGRPVVVGGTGPRGVVAACTYEARVFGVRSAMPMAEARRRCPEAVVLPGRYTRYAEVSGALHLRLGQVTPLVEGIGLDEAFLDVSGACRDTGDGRSLAEALRARIADDLGLACSVGVGRSKLVAKLASVAAKPTVQGAMVLPGPGVVAVEPEEEAGFLRPLPVRALWGVGPATGRRLERLGVRTVADLADLPQGTLERAVGPTAGRLLAGLARGEDQRPVVADRRAKSVGQEETFARDLVDPTVLHRRLVRLVDAATRSLRRAGYAARTVTVKVRFGDFTQVTRSRTLAEPADTPHVLGTVAAELLDEVATRRGVRLLGVSLSGFAGADRARQLRLSLGTGAAERVTVGTPPNAPEAWSAVAAAVDDIRTRFGDAAVVPATLAGSDGGGARRRGEAQWGPSGDGGAGRAEGRGA